ncbi:MAG TPA: magnesium chelatase [Bacteroidia bacterium]|jgi:magnesium chelatase subunit I|nr:magnesium chelatase [Bacteroidia bacterium]
MKLVNTLGELKKEGYKAKPIKDELRDNLIEKIKKKEDIFKGIIGFEDTVIPELERAILSRHNINLLGLRGQAKTRIARQLTDLLDEYIPFVEGSELNDDPLNPISTFAKNLVAEKKDATPIAWLHRSERYVEKLATPDVSMADLIGDVDPIKAANLKLSYADERVLHYGIIPRSNRSIFVINELPDLQARIQVALFNILQEGDIQIRGFKLRIPLDIQFIFTANPEDYTNRGSIVTPLKDRIGSQILTHYPKNIQLSKQITAQEAKLSKDQKENVRVGELVATLIERIAFEARDSEFVDSKSGVSARLTISAYENLVSTAERRMLLNNEKKTFTRIVDLYGVIPSVNGKIELVYEGEQEGAAIVAQNLLGKAIRNEFLGIFPDPGKLKKKKQISPYQGIIGWFSDGNTVDCLFLDTDENYISTLKSIPGLDDLVESFVPRLDKIEKAVMMEFVLFALAEHSLIGKNSLERSIQFKDLLGSMFSEKDLFQPGEENG